MKCSISRVDKADVPPVGTVENSVVVIVVASVGISKGGADVVVM